jgi:hypothetical protein
MTDGIEPKSGAVPGESVETESGGQESASGVPSGETSPNPNPDKPWKEYGIDGWDDKPKEQIAREVVFQRSVAGRQATELGKLRKEHQTASQKLSELQRLAGGNTNAEGQTVKEAVADMDPAEKAMFFKELEEGDPRKALRRALGDLGIPKKEDIQKMIEDGIKEQIGQYHDWNEENSLRTSNPEFVRNEEMVNWFRDKDNPEGLPQRSRNEVLDLVLLGEKNKELAGFTYDWMKKSTMPFSECKRIATLEMNASATAEADKVAVGAEIRTGMKTAPSGSKTVKAEGRAKSWDDI